MTPELMISTFVTLFVIIDPIGLAPLFVALTQGMAPVERRRVAVRAVVTGFGLLALFGIAGEALLQAIGIGLPAFRISGGLLLFLMAVDMLFEKRTERRDRQKVAGLPDPSVFPLATPLIAGPGALAAMILLASQNSGDAVALLAIRAVLASVIALTFLMFLAGGVIERLLGVTGIKVVTRLLGILLAALSVQFVLDGLRDLGLLGPEAMPEDPARLIYLLVLGLVIGLALMASRRRWSKLLRDIGIWGLIFAMVVIAYGFRDTLRRELFPASVTQLEGGSIALGRAADGHFQVDIFVNETPVRFLVDTGATDVVLSRKDAAAAGIDPARLEYSGVANTANGRVATAPVRLERMRLGGLVDENFPASVNSGDLDVSLLGMRYLSRFSRIEIAGDQMILHQ